MLGMEIEELLFTIPETQEIFRGVFSSNNIPKIDECLFPSAYIVNTDNDYEPGEHWVAFYFESNSSLPEYFDSYGLYPLRSSFLKFMNNKPFKYSTHTIQNLYSSVCGHYVIYFVFQRCHKHSFQNIVSSFTTDTVWNDLAIEAYIDRLFAFYA